MRFKVCRTSMLFSEEDAPCEGAFREEYKFVDERIIYDPADLPPRHGLTGTEWWYAEGKNHRVEDGHIKRDLVGTGWFIDIPNLEALLEFVQRNGKVIVHPRNDMIPPSFELEIYDYWRE